MPVRVDTETVSLNGSQGLRLVADAYGTFGDPAVILLHGGGQNRRTWRSAATQIAAEGYYVLALDLRGHGDSDWSAAIDYSCEAYAADILEIITQVGGKAFLAGASLGGRGALVAAACDPDKVSGLALIDVTPSLDPDNSAAYQTFLRSARDGFDRVEDAAEMLNAMSGRSSKGNPQKLMAYLRSGDDGKLYWRWDPHFIDPQFVSRPEEVEELEAYARQIRQPALLIRAEHSEVVREEDVKRFLDVVPHAELRQAKGVGHMLTGDANDVYAPILIDFLRYTAAGGA